MMECVVSDLRLNVNNSKHPLNRFAQFIHNMSRIMLANISIACNCYKTVNQIPAKPDGKDANLLIHCKRTQLIQPYISRSGEPKHVQRRRKKKKKTEPIQKEMLSEYIFYRLRVKTLKGANNSRVHYLFFIILNDHLFFFN